MGEAKNARLRQLARQAGYYWVLQDGEIEAPFWCIAEWCSINGCWWVSGTEEPARDSDFMRIDERPIHRPEVS
jgi:hypothetical protein